MARKRKENPDQGAESVPARQMGRPPFQWTPEVEDYIWTKMIAGMSLRSLVARSSDDFEKGAFPSYDTIMERIKNERNFSEQYARVKDLQQDLLGEDLIDIIDGIHPQFTTADLAQRKASVEERKWIMGKLRRKKWGEVKVTEVTGANGTPLVQPQIINTRDMAPEARMALYNALQLAVSQSEAEDAEYTETEEDAGNSR